MVRLCKRRKVITEKEKKNRSMEPGESWGQRRREDSKGRVEGRGSRCEQERVGRGREGEQEKMNRVGGEEWEGRKGVRKRNYRMG